MNKFMNKGFVFTIVMVVLSQAAWSLFWGGAVAGNGDTSCPKGGGSGFGGGGDGTPWPFESYNTKVELADGEDYVLVGRIVIAQDIIAGSGEPRRRLRAYLEVDLDEHPWLASSNRRRGYAPYPLLGSVTQWRPLERQRVKLIVRADGHIVLTDANKLAYVIFLRSLHPLGRAGPN